MVIGFSSLGHGHTTGEGLHVQTQLAGKGIYAFLRHTTALLTALWPGLSASWQHYTVPGARLLAWAGLGLATKHAMHDASIVVEFAYGVANSYSPSRWLPVRSECRLQIPVPSDLKSQIPILISYVQSELMPDTHGDVQSCYDARYDPDRHTGGLAQHGLLELDDVIQPHAERCHVRSHQVRSCCRA